MYSPGVFYPKLDVDFSTMKIVVAPGLYFKIRLTICLL